MLENKKQKINPNARRGGKNTAQGGLDPRRGRATKRRRRAVPEKGARSEFEQKIINIRRVTRVVQGGRRFSFSVVTIIGDRSGTVGVGVGKGSDTARAIEKSVRDAKKNKIKVKTTDTMSISHEVRVKYSSAEVLIIPVQGKGLVAGSAVRSVLDLAGITDVTAKILSRSKNKLNIARATIEALGQLA